MNLSTERLILSPLTSEAIPEIHRFHCNPLVARYNTIGIPQHISMTEALLAPVIAQQSKEKPDFYGWTLRLKSDHRFIGEAGMSISNNRFESAEIHYHIEPELWGKGYATEVARELIRFAFEDLKLHRVQAGAATENIGSHRVMEKAGMTREGLRRKILPIRGEWYDNYTYAILEDDPRP